MMTVADAIERLSEMAMEGHGDKPLILVAANQDLAEAHGFEINDDPEQPCVLVIAGDWV